MPTTAKDKKIQTIKAENAQLRKENARLDDDAIRLCAESDEVMDHFRGVLEKVSKLEKERAAIMRCQRCGKDYPKRTGRFCGACLPGCEGKGIELTDYSKEFLIGIIDHKNEHLTALEAENAELKKKVKRLAKLVGIFRPVAVDKPVASQPCPDCGRAGAHYCTGKHGDSDNNVAYTKAPAKGEGDGSL